MSLWKIDDPTVLIAYHHVTHRVPKEEIHVASIVSPATLTRSSFLSRMAQE